jgi:hypothetical protein
LERLPTASDRRHCTPTAQATWQRQGAECFDGEWTYSGKRSISRKRLTLRPAPPPRTCPPWKIHPPAGSSFWALLPSHNLPLPCRGLPRLEIAHNDRNHVTTGARRSQIKAERLGANRRRGDHMMVFHGDLVRPTTPHHDVAQRTGAMEKTLHRGGDAAPDTVPGATMLAGRPVSPTVRGRSPGGDRDRGCRHRHPPIAGVGGTVGSAVGGGCGVSACGHVVVAHALRRRNRGSRPALRRPLRRAPRLTTPRARLPTTEPRQERRPPAAQTRPAQQSLTVRTDAAIEW